MSPRLVPILRGALCVGLFGLGLGAGCWAIRRVLPFPEIAEVTPKVAHFTAHHDDYDTIFLGSSHIYFAVVPSIFDPLAAAEGLPTHSFNAGIAGLRPPEDAYYLDYLLRHPPQHLRWVFVELSRVRTSVNTATFGTIRAVYWHDWRRFWLLCKRALYVEPTARKGNWLKSLEEWREPLADLGVHLSLFLQYETNLGRGSMLVSSFTDTDRQPSLPPDKTLGEDFAGWIPSGQPEAMTDSQRAAYENALAERREKKQRDDLSDPVSQQALESMVAKIEKLGAEPVLIVPPTTYKSHFFPSAERVKKTMTLDFSDLTRYPELYVAGNRLDVEHLNTAGAEVFTRILAKTWAAEVKRRQ